MSSDEIEYNPFYHILQNKYRKKYEPALSKCWTICIPCSAALRGIEVTEQFVELHILRHIDHKTLMSTDEKGSHMFHLEGSSLTLHQAPLQIEEPYVIKILSVETGYNKEFQQYKIFIVDKPLSPLFIPKPPDYLTCLLDQKITTLDAAVRFLTHFSEHSSVLIRLDKELNSFCDAHKSLAGDVSIISDKIHDILGRHWTLLLQTHPLDVQRDGRFQHLLTVCLENYIMNRLHNLVFPAVSSMHREKDSIIMKRALELAGVGVTADQLGAPEDFAVPLPAAVVELASLDSFNCPIDKLTCLRTTLELMLAEVKGAIVDAQSLMAGDSHLPTLNTDDLIPLLESVIIQAKPLHMASNLFYVENFQWTLSPNDASSFSLVTFKAAVQELLLVDASQLKPRSEKVIRELGLEELIKVTGELGQRFDRSGERRSEGPISPLDRQLERVTAMIEASTRELSSSEESAPLDQLSKSVDMSVPQKQTRGS
ncbi:ankyrin repeat domain-containing protein 27 [Anabrus simplex]|uniref:ankyrin repeat domain-containing protein 27 n=1 Tax=Anabrus simplex TaxID=316456 RepID=UPI0035A34EC1